MAFARSCIYVSANQIITFSQDNQLHLSTLQNHWRLQGLRSALACTRECGGDQQSPFYFVPDIIGETRNPLLCCLKHKKGKYHPSRPIPKCRRWDTHAVPWHLIDPECISVHTNISLSSATTG